MKKVIWLADSKERIKEFPEEVRRDIGYALNFAQKGEKHPHAKPLKGKNFTSKGVFEIVENASSGTYRVVYAVKVEEFLYVLHAFQKKSKTGIATPKKEIDLIQRLHEAKKFSSHN